MMALDRSWLSLGNTACLCVGVCLRTKYRYRKLFHSYSLDLWSVQAWCFLPPLLRPLALGHLHFSVTVPASALLADGYCYL